MHLRAGVVCAHTDRVAHQGLLAAHDPGHDQLQRMAQQPEQQHHGQLDNQLLLVDLVSFDHCQEVNASITGPYWSAAELLGHPQPLRLQACEFCAAQHAEAAVIIHSQQTCRPAIEDIPLTSQLLPAAFHTVQLVRVPPAVEQQVLLQFDVGAWAQPLPSRARQQADQQQRLPQESIGLWVPPHPRISNHSLYKLEQRLAKGRTLDVQRIVRALQEQFPESQQPGEPHCLDEAAARGCMMPRLGNQAAPDRLC